MADASTVPPTGGTSVQLPVAAIVCIAIGAYIFLVALLVIIRQCLMQRGIWKDCNCCGKEGEPGCCECWIAFAEACNCCRSPSVETCLDSICPARKHLWDKKMDCTEIILCQCCAGCCGNDEPVCDCGQFACNCNCQPPECENMNFLCCQLQPRPIDDD